MNFRKLKTYKTKSMFLIVPVILLVALSIAISSQVGNLKSAIDQSVFGSLDEQSRLIELKKESQFSATPGGGGGATFRIGGDTSDQEYTENDLAKIKNLDGVQSAAINSSIPVSNVNATNLFEGKEFTIPSLTGIDSDLGGLYTSEDFTYTEGEAIPMVLSAQAFSEMYEDWGGNDEITLDFTAARSGGPEAFEASNPVKRRAIDYNKTDLLGKEFTIEVGGLDAIQTYSNEATDAGLTFKKLTQDELNAKVEERKSTISEYWDYEKISTPMKYTFKVVGIIEDETNTNSYIPEDFAKKLMSDYIANQINARTSKELSTDLLDSTFKGIKFDGVEIQSSIFGFSGARMIRFGMRGGPGGAASVDEQEELIEYNIPGLVIETDRDTSNGNPFGEQADIVGYLSDTSIYEKSAKSGTTLLLKAETIYDRSKVVEALNDAGYAYQDVFKSEVFAELQNTLNLISTGFVLFFTGFTVVIIIFTMGKFVSEGRREIGILRAIGATRANIRNMFVSQAVLYAFFGYLLGTVLGVGLTYLAANFISKWFDSTVLASLKETFNVVVSADSSVFMNISWQSFAAYSVLLLVITLLISLIPAIRASNISPVVAIKGE